VTLDLSPRPLRRTDLTFGPVVLGTMTFGTQLDERGSAEVVHAARELGVTMFDCANSYGGGRSEEILGRIVRPFRDEVQVVTKVGGRRSVDGDGPRLDRDSVLRGCDASLERLGVDHIDLYYLHMPDESTPIAETLAACQELVDAGKIRHLGLSNYAAWQITDATHLADANGWPPIRALQPMYNLLARRLEEEYVACTEHLDVSNLVYNPLAGGLLTGKHRYEAGPEEGTRFTRRTNYMERYWQRELFEAVAALDDTARAAGITLIELSLRWLLSRPHVDGVLLGVSSLEHLRSNVAALDGPAPDDDTLARVDEVWAGLRGAAPGYHR
jgi:aryl-alcohol dehydrogenase-like predicted oxidoreductase